MAEVKYVDRCPICGEPVPGAAMLEHLFYAHGEMPIAGMNWAVEITLEEGEYANHDTGKSNQARTEPNS